MVQELVGYMIETHSVVSSIYPFTDDLIYPGIFRASFLDLCAIANVFIQDLSIFPDDPAYDKLMNPMSYAFLFNGETMSHRVIHWRNRLKKASICKSSVIEGKKADALLNLHPETRSQGNSYQCCPMCRHTRDSSRDPLRFLLRCALRSALRPP